MRPKRLPKLTPAHLFPALSLVLLGAVLVLGAAHASAATCDDSFTNAAGGSWSAAANWSTGTVPVDTQDACVPAGVGTVEIGPGASARVRTIVAASPLKIDAGGFLTVKDNEGSFSNELTDADVEGVLGTEGSSVALSGASVVNGEIDGTSSTIVTLDGGSLAGEGAIDTRFVAAAGKVEPGGPGAVGVLHFGSTYSQDDAAELDLDLASDGSFDRIAPPANANALIDGTIAVHLLGTYAPSVGTGWEFISGTAGVSKGWTVTPSEFSAHSVPGGAELTLDSALPTGPDGGSGPGSGGTETGGPGDGTGTDPGTGSSGTGTDPGTGSSGTGSSGSGDQGSGSPGSNAGTGGGSNPLAPTPNPHGSTTRDEPARCVVPKLKGLKAAAAKKALRRAHCAPGKVKRRPSRRVKRGRVMAAGKAPGKALAAGAKVNLAVSSGR
jgi:hypothetical protein